MRIALIVLLILTICSPVAAGSKGKLAGFFADYDDMTTRASERLSEVEEARKDGYSSDPRSLMDLGKEILDALREVTQYYYAQGKQTRIGASAQPDQRALLAMMESYKAIGGALNAETTYQTGAKSKFILLVRAKYEDLFRFADEEVRAAKKENTAP